MKLENLTEEQVQSFSVETRNVRYYFHLKRDGKYEIIGASKKANQFGEVSRSANSIESEMKILKRNYDRVYKKFISPKRIVPKQTSLYIGDSVAIVFVLDLEFDQLPLFVNSLNPIVRDTIAWRLELGL